MIEAGKQTVFDIILETPGISQAEILQEFKTRTGKRVSQGFVYHKCQDLLHENRIRVERKGNQNAYYPITTAVGSQLKSSISYTIEEGEDGSLVVVSYTIGKDRVTLAKGLPLEKLPEFHRAQQSFKKYLTG